jgi:hypothetical protein
MRFEIGLAELEEMISKSHFANEGDQFEQIWWIYFKERFPNHENFWRYFVVPLTKRIEPVKDPNERIRFRDGIPDDLKDIASLNYSMFLNLVYSYDHLHNFRLSSFEDFYMHLGSACDLAEEVLLRIYLLILECSCKKSPILQELNKVDFIKLAEQWYDTNYSKVYADYLKKGKPSQIRLPARKYILDEYFEEDQDWNEYKRYSQKLREYRNVIVHEIQIGKLRGPGGILLVPKKEKILNYKKWANVFVAQQDIEKVKTDFIVMKEQMILDIGKLEIILNKLWERPINDLHRLLFQDKNEILLMKYNLILT